MSWKHPEDVPHTLTRRAYALRGTVVSQNIYAHVVADAYEDVRANAIQDLIQTAQDALKGEPADVRDTPATLATAELLDLPWEAVASILDVWMQEAARVARERRAPHQSNGGEAA